MQTIVIALVQELSLSRSNYGLYLNTITIEYSESGIEYDAIILVITILPHELE